MITDTPDGKAAIQEGLATSDFEIECRHVATRSQLGRALADATWDLVLHCGADRMTPPVAVELVRASGRDIPVIVVTQAIDDARAQGLLDAGVRDVIRRGDWGWLRAAMRREHDDALVRRQNVDSLSRVRLRELEMAGLVAAAHEGTWMIGDSGCTRWASPKMATLLGLEVDALLGRPVEDFVVGELPAAWRLAIRGQADPPPQRPELQLRRVGAPDWWASISAGTIVHEHHHSLLLMVEDVSEQRAQRVAMRRAHTMRALGELSGGITHDLGNILGPLSLHLQVLETQGLSAAAEQTRAKMLGIVRRGQSMLERLRNFSRQQPEGEPQSVDLTQQAEAAVELVRPRLKLREGISIELTARPHTQGLGVADELVRALVNLLVNAVDAMPSPGVIHVRVDEDEGGPFIEVEDEGSGMPPEVEARALEPLFTTKEDGTGLGLSNVFAFAQRVGGRLELDTQVGRGTRVRMVLASPP